jgi:hypothetical protein
METTIRTKQYGSEIILPNLTSEAGAKTYGPPCNSSKQPTCGISEILLAAAEKHENDKSIGEMSAFYLFFENLTFA